MVKFNKLAAFNGEKVIVPKWTIAVGIAVCLSVASLFIASIALNINKKTNGLYNESCERRNCEDKLGLKCIKKVCLCPENHFYLDKCYKKSTYDEICYLDNHCKKEENLICGIKSKCDCSLENYWNIDLKKCRVRKTFMEVCNSEECKKNLNLVCELGICNCENKFIFWNGSSCIDKKRINETCNKSDECMNHEGTHCLHSKCDCLNNEYFKESESKCVKRLAEFESCTFDQMCLNPMFCSDSHSCRCQKNMFYHSLSSRCIDQYFLNGKCSKDFECRQDLGLTCLDNVCLCASSDYTWSSKSKECKLSYAKFSCNQDVECNESENLICRLSNKCNCPITSQIKMCDCLRNETLEHYWNGSTCSEAFSYKSACFDNYECRSLSQNTICSSAKKCECSDYSLYFWNGEKCLPKKNYGKSCDANYQCLNSELTICSQSTCKCDTSEYFWLKKCILRVGQNQPCTSDIMCLIPMTCQSNRCTCGNNHYFDNTSSLCVEKLLYGFKCHQNIECRSDLSLTCKENVCVCDSLDKKWSLNSNKCQLTYNKGICFDDSDCNTDQKLICLNETSKDCSCPNTSLKHACDCNRVIHNEQYWNGVECTKTNFFGMNCSENYHCQTLTQNTKCIDNICKCADFFKQYWNGKECREKKGHLEKCNQNIECIVSDLTICRDGHCSCSRGQYYHEALKKCVPRLGESEACYNDTMCLEAMFCHSFSKSCSCEENEYFSNLTQECKIKKSINYICDNDWQCMEKKGLTCQNNRCLCRPQSHTWDKNKNECKISYSTLSCNSNDDCNTSENLICSDFNNRCKCPSNETMKICDCLISDKYWNGEVCVDAKSFGLPCNHSFECKIKEKLSCRSNICQCENNEIFNNEDNICKELCPDDSVLFGNQCFFFSTSEEKSDDAEKRCNNLYGNKNWNIAIVKDLETNKFLKEYFQNINSTEPYWLDSIEVKNGKEDQWKHNKQNVDYTFCNTVLGKKTVEIYYKNDCFYDDKNKNTNMKYICRLEF